MSDADKPYVLCGCIYAETEEQALLFQQIIRDVLGGRGFMVEHVEREDGAETRRVIRR